MNPARIELCYYVTAREWLRVRHHLKTLDFRNSNGLLGQILTRPLLEPAINLLALYIMAPSFLRFCDSLLRGGVPEGFGVFDFVETALFALILYRTVEILWGALVRYTGIGCLAALEPEGRHWGDHKLVVADDAVTVERKSSTHILNWQAILAVEETRHAIILRLNHYSALVVPKSAFMSTDQENHFRDFVMQRVQPAT